VRQGTVIGRDGRVFIDYDHDGTDARTWIGGHTVTIVDGTFRL
jgi:predicted PhzF superfamily epimerase YddE/YHI9